MTTPPIDTWSLDELAAAGSALAADANERTEIIGRSLEAGLADQLGTVAVMRVLGKLIFDHPDVVASVHEPALFREAANDRLHTIPPAVRERVSEHWNLSEYFDQAEAPSPRTYKLTGLLAWFNATTTAQQMVRRDLASNPAGGGGAVAVLPRFRYLTLYHRFGEFCAKASAFDCWPEDVTGGEVFWGSYLLRADLHSQAEAIGAEATAGARGRYRILILNARAGLVLDLAQATGDAAALDHTRTQLVTDAWDTYPNPATRNVQARLARLSGKSEDWQTLEAMDRLLRQEALSA